MASYVFAEAALGAVCNDPAALASADIPCTPADAECLQDSGATTFSCQCVSTHYNDQSGSCVESECLFMSVNHGHFDKGLKMPAFNISLFLRVLHRCY